MVKTKVFTIEVCSPLRLHTCGLRCVFEAAKPLQKRISIHSAACGRRSSLREAPDT